MVRRVWILGALTWGLPVSAQTADEAPLHDQVVDAVQPFVIDRDFEGIVLVAEEGERVLWEAFPADGSRETPIDPSTPFPVGSITKTFTAEAIRILVEDGEAALDTRLAEFAPDVPSADAITLRQLLVHSSGIRDYYATERFRTARTHPIGAREFADWIAAEPLDFQPGSASSYSNSGYNLLALLVEARSGGPLRDFLEARVFRPLGMTRSGSLLAARPAGLPRGRAPAHAPELLGPPADLDPSWLLGSGDLYASGDDLARWGSEIGERVRSGTDTSPFGWGPRSRNGTTYLEQNGRIPGYASMLRVVPSARRVIVVLSSVESDAVGPIADAVQDVLDGRPVDARSPRPTYAVPTGALGAYAGVYEIAPGFRLTVRATAGGLEVATGEGDALDYAVLRPIGPDRFFFRVGYTDVGFARDPDGSVSGLTWAGTGPYPRVR